MKPAEDNINQGAGIVVDYLTDRANENHYLKIRDLIDSGNETGAISYLQGLVSGIPRFEKFEQFLFHKQDIGEDKPKNVGINTNVWRSDRVTDFAVLLEYEVAQQVVELIKES